ncbi:hypothetical protein B0H13DRAFT_1888515 [Mycena leptocephala]|nr:hypothetical protein B0H13DRAFT_1888515 [Mycena leptocephala]
MINCVFPVGPYRGREFMNAIQSPSRESYSDESDMGRITTRAFLHYWATNQVSKAAFTESRAITHSVFLSKAKKVVKERFFLDYSLTNFVRTIRGMAPTAFKIFDSFSTTTRQLNKATEKFLEKEELMKGAAALTLLRGASQNNNYPQSVNRMYFAATGGQRQHFPVLGIYGFSVGYTSIILNLTKTANDATAVKDATEPSVDPHDDLNDVDDVSPSTPTAAGRRRSGPKRSAGDPASSFFYGMHACQQIERRRSRD